MKAYRFRGVLQDREWIMPAYVKLDDHGAVLSLSKEKDRSQTYIKVEGFALPGMQNAHSHAFQYAMVGLTEQHDLSGNRDDFWGWRNAMYQLALSIDPDQMEAIATMLYSEMLRNGYTEVAEFHYVHHQESGAPYSNLAELGERLVAAAQTVGLKITLIPVFYNKGDFGENARDGQRRFLSNDIDDYLSLLEASKDVVKNYDDSRIACGVHSLRAVDPQNVKELIAQIDGDLPFHMHVSEQLKEVEKSIVYLGKRPVEWLLDNVDLNENYHLVHCTHLSETEITRLAKSKANAVLCPSTEGNLGDGVFSLKSYQDFGGNWSIGSDSQIGLNPFEDLRILDYGQRIRSHRRNIFYGENNGNSGSYAIDKLVSNGRLAMGNQQKSYFEIGQSFDALVMDAQIPILSVCSPENLCSTIVYASDVSMHLGTMVNGEWVIKKGKHQKQLTIRRDFTRALKKLKNR